MRAFVLFVKKKKKKFVIALVTFSNEICAGTFRITPSEK